jgi:UDP-2,3-diacylglucosamine hydrolase
MHTTHRILAVSDLHLFARRSEGAARFEKIRPQLSQVDALVLNGDTFDFRWSSLPTQAVTRRAAVDWLTQLLESIPGCDLHFVQGNHDCLEAFTDDLRCLALVQPRFDWHEYWLRLGEALFLHGDCVQSPSDPDGLARYRDPWKQDRQRAASAAVAYAWADRLGFTRLAHRWCFPRRKVIVRITAYLDRACPDWRSGVRTCCFGHTHLPFTGHQHEGVTFHNTGSGIRNLGFNPVACLNPIVPRAVGQSA